MKHPNDTNLDFLKNCTNEELEFLVRLIIDAGGMTNELEKTSAFKLHRPNHVKYVDEIIEDYQKFAANTAVTAVRGYGVCYREALTDTLDNLDVGYDKEFSLAELEGLLLRLGVPRYLKKMKRDEDRENFQKMLDGLDCPFDTREMPSGSIGENAAAMGVGAGLGATVGAAAATGGVAGGSTTAAAGSAGLMHLAAGAGAVTLGPVFLAAAIAAASGSALWGGALLMTPAKRVVIPATIYIAKLRSRVERRMEGCRP